MCSNISSYLDHQLSHKSLLLALFVVFFITACGIKGPLYQTSQEPDTASETVVEQQSENEEQPVYESETGPSTVQELEPQ